MSQMLRRFPQEGNQFQKMLMILTGQMQLILKQMIRKFGSLMMISSKQWKKTQPKRNNPNKMKKNYKKNNKLIYSSCRSNS